MVHDAARPCVRVADIERLMTAVGAADGGLLAAPVRDTLKRQSDHTDVPGQALVAQTVARAGLWRALTPQAFRRQPLADALVQARAARQAPTDEAQAMEWMGVQPLLIERAEDNIKVTTAHDLALAQFLLRAQV